MGSVLEHHVSRGEGSGGRGEAELDGLAREESSRGGREDGVGGEGRDLSEEEESRIREDEVLVVKQDGGLQKELIPLPSAAPPQQQQQVPPGPLVRWERFLPIRSLKVLLVENDDSTRQVVSALLRNCSYDVTATANGLEAWKILEDLTNHVDLVLTEVVMPCLSGFGLLCKIMNHKTCKNIPVIMMSSHDSMGIVFKCLSKGAVDFLVKPIRKNELKNLWQHVWRRCHSSSGSGSESGIQTQNSVKSKSVESDDNNGSNSEDDNTSTGLNIPDGSDNGSGTQSSWTKRAVEIESPQPMSPLDQLADPPNSTCAQVIHPKAEEFCNEGVPIAGSKDCQEKEILDDKSMGKDLEIGVHRDPESWIGYHPSGKDEKVPLNLTESLKERMSETDKENNRSLNEDLLKLDGSKAASEPSAQAADLIGVIANTSNTQTLATGASNDTPIISGSKEKASDVAEELPSLELSLKRLTSTRDGGTGSTDDRSVLRRSDLSAFSRYNTSAASYQIPTGCGASYYFPIENSTEGVKMESTCNNISMSNVVPPNQGSNGSSNNNVVGSTTKNAFAKPATHVEKSAAISAFKGTHSSAFHPVQRSSATQVIQENIDDLTASSTMVQPRGIHCQVQMQQHHYHHHHVQNIQQQQNQLQNQADRDDFTLKIMSTIVPQCGSSNVFSGTMECNAANYSVNGSVSGSNHGSNVHNGSSAAANTGGLIVDSDSGLAAKSGGGSGNGSGSGSGSGVDENRFAQREAALNKFRQKRKERCFAKKVRYQSRKRLAEQRPRVRGQFVRQAVREQKDRDAYC